MLIRLTLTRVIPVVAIILGMTACQKDSEVQSLSPDENEFTEVDYQSVTKLGEPIKNAYSVKNMQAALDAIISENAGSRIAGLEEINIRTTHLYVKFAPESKEELNLLSMDTSLILYEIPLLNEIEEEGMYYHDPEVPLDKPTYQYTVVRVDQVLPNVAYEILDECYIPEEDEELALDPASRELENDAANLLIDEALTIAGYIIEEQSLTESASRTLRKTQWTPKGRITVMDDQFASGTNIEIPIVGVEVRARVGIRTLKGNTDTNGYYTCHGPRFRSEANYSMVYEKDNFRILAGDNFVAYRDGPKQKADWDKVLSGHQETYYVTIYRAAYHYYYQDNEGLRRPPENGFWNKKLEIKATYLSDNDRDNTHIAIRRFAGSDIKIHSKWRTPVLLYSTTIHEMAHASHWKMSTSSYNFGHVKVSESWARGVEWALTRMVYPNYRGRDYTEDSDYTAVVADMIDNSSSDNTNDGLNIAEGDSVENYTIRQIEDALDNEYSWEGWRKDIYNQTNNSTKSHLHDLFEAY